MCGVQKPGRASARCVRQVTHSKHKERRRKEWRRTATWASGLSLFHSLFPLLGVLVASAKKANGRARPAGEEEEKGKKRRRVVGGVCA